MVLFFYAVLNVLSLYIVIKYYTKNLHVLETVTYWLIGALMVQNYSALNYINFHFFEIPDVLSLEMAHFLNRIILEPGVCVWFLNGYVMAASIGSKAARTLSFAAILTGLETLEVSLGVIRYQNWHMGWTSVVWTAVLLAVVGFMRFFRKKLIKGVSRS